MQKKPEDDFAAFLEEPKPVTVKAKLDDSELSEELPKGMQKVDLDLDDAPFLMDEEETPAPAGERPEIPVGTEEEEVKGPWWKRKLVILAAAGAMLLVIAGVAAWQFMKTPPPVAVEVAPPPPPEPEEEAPPPPPNEIVVELAPFILEQLDQTGRPVLLAVKFSFVTTDDTAALMLSDNPKLRVLVRDAVYYYLSNKSVAFLSDGKFADHLKKEVLDVVNGQMSGHDFDKVLIDSYVGI